MAPMSTIRSAPALAVAWRQRYPDAMRVAVVDTENLVPMYRIDGANPPTEAAAAARLASDVAERLRRLVSAYGEWSVFEPAPYFDLLPEQALQLVSIVERVTTVHVTFFVDLLLPSYKAAASYLAEMLSPAAAQDVPNVRWQQEMGNRWHSLLAVLDLARGRLADDAGYLALNGANEERNRWRAAWAQVAVTPGMPGGSLTFERVPTLTLSIDFPLPANRQPGRLRRLRRARARRRQSIARWRNAP
jgi:hypothetical protein